MRKVENLIIDYCFAREISNNTFVGSNSIADNIANGIIPVDAMKRTNSTDATGIQWNAETSIFDSRRYTYSAHII